MRAWPIDQRGSIPPVARQDAREESESYENPGSIATARKTVKAGSEQGVLRAPKRAVVVQHFPHCFDTRLHTYLRPESSTGAGKTS